VELAIAFFQILCWSVVYNCSRRYFVATIRPATRGGAIGQLPPPRNFHKRMCLLGATRSYIILPPPPKISVGCGPSHHHLFDRSICSLTSQNSYFPLLTTFACSTAPNAGEDSILPPAVHHSEYKAQWYYLERNKEGNVTGACYKLEQKANRYQLHSVEGHPNDIRVCCAWNKTKMKLSKCFVTCKERAWLQAWNEGFQTSSFLCFYVKSCRYLTCISLDHCKIKELMRSTLRFVETLVCQKAKSLIFHSGGVNETSQTRVTFSRASFSVWNAACCFLPGTNYPNGAVFFNAMFS